MKKLCRIGDVGLTSHMLWHIPEVSEGVGLLRDGVQRGGSENGGGF